MTSDLLPCTSPSGWYWKGVASEALVMLQYTAWACAGPARPQNIPVATLRMSVYCPGATVSATWPLVRYRRKSSPREAPVCR